MTVLLWGAYLVLLVVRQSIVAWVNSILGTPCKGAVGKKGENIWAGSWCVYTHTHTIRFSSPPIRNSSSSLFLKRGSSSETQQMMIPFFSFHPCIHFTYPEASSKVETLIIERHGNKKERVGETLVKWHVTKCFDRSNVSSLEWILFSKPSMMPRLFWYYKSTMPLVQYAHREWKQNRAGEWRQNCFSSICLCHACIILFS